MSITRIVFWTALFVVAVAMIFTAYLNGSGQKQTSHIAVQFSEADKIMMVGGAYSDKLLFARYLNVEEATSLSLLFRNEDRLLLKEPPGTIGTTDIVDLYLFRGTRCSVVSITPVSVHCQNRYAYVSNAPYEWCLARLSSE
jgi:hypothetical protein